MVSNQRKRPLPSSPNLNSGRQPRSKQPKTQHKTSQILRRPTPTRTPSRALTLACPFYKHNPATYQPCARLKLSKISYVKQHLMRQHMVSVHCQQCLKIFSTHDELKIHGNGRCEKRSGEVEGITKSIREQLSRRADQSVGEAEQWRDIWKIIFGREPPASPYIDLDLPEEINLYNDYLFSQVPNRLVEHEVPQSLDARRKLVLDTVQEVARDWKCQWQQGRVAVI